MAGARWMLEKRWKKTGWIERNKGYKDPDAGKDKAGAEGGDEG